MGWFNHQPDHPPKRVWDEKDSSLKWPGKPWHIENVHNESQLFIYIMRWSFMNHCRSTALLVSSTTLWIDVLLVTLELWHPLVLQKKIQRSLHKLLSYLRQPVWSKLRNDFMQHPMETKRHVKHFYNFLVPGNFGVGEENLKHSSWIHLLTFGWEKCSVSIWDPKKFPYHPWDWYIYLHENHKNQPFM